MDEWPSPIAVAKGLEELLTKRLDDFATKQIVLTRDEAVLCLGLISGLAKQLEREENRQGLSR